MTRVVVLGAAVMDLVFRTDELPDWNQNLATQAKDFELRPGGKGLNQAVAAARYDKGADVYLVSIVGNDAFGGQILDTLRKERVSADYVEKLDDPQVRTPAVGVFLNNSGEAAYLGSKGKATPDPFISNLVERAKGLIRDADLLLVTLEVPVQAAISALSYLSDERYSVLNPAPPIERRDYHAGEVDRLLSSSKYIIPNEWEAARLFPTARRGRGRRGPKRLAEDISEKSQGVAIVTCAERGAWVSIRGETAERFPTRGVIAPPSTVGASDAFCAALGMALMIPGTVYDPNLDPYKAIQIANLAARWVVLNKGGFQAMPDDTEIRKIIADVETRKARRAS